jgi:hypothetical protein
VKFGGRRPPPAPDPAVIRTLAGLLAETGLTERALREYIEQHQ